MRKILLWLICGLLLFAGRGGELMGQTIRGKQGNTGGMQSSQLVGGKVLVFTKGPGKRTIYAIGSEMKVKMINGLKVEGRLQAVRDTGFILGNKMITYDSLEAYYVPMRICLLVGTALCVGGGGYMLLDGFNGLTNHKDPPFHVEALAVGIPMLAAGAAILPFKQVKRRTSVWRPLPMDLW